MSHFASSAADRDDRWVWRRWFAWRPVYALLVQSSDELAPLEARWDGLPGEKRVWLAFVQRRYVIGRWHYLRPARPRPVRERREAEQNAALRSFTLLPIAADKPGPSRDRTARS